MTISRAERLTGYNIEILDIGNSAAGGRFTATAYSGVDGKVFLRESASTRKKAIEMLVAAVYRKHCDLAFRKHKGRCAICSRKLRNGHWETDHIKKRSQGGTHHVSNLRPVCSGDARSGCGFHRRRHGG